MNDENNNYFLSNLLSRKTISLNVEVDNWEEAVRTSGNLLIQAGSIKPAYVEAMIESVKTNGAYIVIAPGVAIPHASPSESVLEPCMSLVTLKNPVDFGNENNDPVKLVIAFGTVDNKAHVKALSKLARILGDQEKLDGLFNAEKPEEVEEIVSAPV